MGQSSSPSEYQASAHRRVKSLRPSAEYFLADGKILKMIVHQSDYQRIKIIALLRSRFLAASRIICFKIGVWAAANKMGESTAWAWCSERGLPIRYLSKGLPRLWIDDFDRWNAALAVNHRTGLGAVPKEHYDPDAHADQLYLPGVAYRLSVCTRTVHRLIRYEGLPAERVGPTVRVSLQELRNWLWRRPMRVGPATNPVFKKPWRMTR
jgi:excisionase family DNA binding protein